ncbi:hypothetical protein [Arsenicicoccus dermatophilus]|uniref:hypothetical protein n=1 Tax=Arsenicicoccus dermatophilus TaxID=1076331 RepID=UPI003916DCD9
MTLSSDALREWTVAQVTLAGRAEGFASIPELDWSGPEPSDLADVGELRPLLLTHHGYQDRPEYSHYLTDLGLPRGARVIGRHRVLPVGASPSMRWAWPVGDDLALQRLWDSGAREQEMPGSIRLTGPEIAERMSTGVSDTEVWEVYLEEVRELDVSALVQAFPAVSRLSIAGDRARLENASELNRLHRLRLLWMRDVFGLTAQDVIHPSQLEHLAFLLLHSIPKEYAMAMRAQWRRTRAQGVSVSVTAARSEEWVERTLEDRRP